MPTKAGIRRFTVMAMLQAARASALGLEQDSAYSWGLNRAIFYAAAKRGFRQSSGEPSSGASSPAARPDEPTLYRLGHDEAYRDPTSSKLYFMIGGKRQTKTEFEHSVGVRFGSAKNFQVAWAEALQIVKGFDRRTLESPQEFYAQVYKPRRDELAAAWAEKFGVPYAPSPGSRRSK
ncbi:MAG: hypothetical protein L3K15_04575 [Thermoplasmata archaeon]|nr:hypothetical protein [Thermoplasmata archaeon]